MLSKYLHEHHYTLAKNWLLAIGGGSWVGWIWLKSISVLCQILLPITGVFSFGLFLVINFKKIMQGFKDILTQFKK